MKKKEMLRELYVEYIEWRRNNVSDAIMHSNEVLNTALPDSSYFRLSFSDDNPGRRNEDGGTYRMVSEPEDFSSLVLEVLHYLQKPAEYSQPYKLSLTESAQAKVGRKGKLVLEETVEMHNSLVNARKGTIYR